MHWSDCIDRMKADLHEMVAGYNLTRANEDAVERLYAKLMLVAGDQASALNQWPAALGQVHRRLDQKETRLAEKEKILVEEVARLLGEVADQKEQEQRLTAREAEQNGRSSISWLERRT